MKNPIHQLRKLALALAALASLATAHRAAAATIEFDVYLPKYGYVVVKPNSNTGGRIQWDAAHYYYYTDRVNRGERLYIFETPATGEATGANSAVFEIWCDSLHKDLVGPAFANWYGYEWYQEYVVPTDPAKDNIYFDFYTSLGAMPPKRIPIGYRNP